MRFTSTLVAVVGLLSAAPFAIATITIIGPSANSYWVQDTSNTIAWEFTAGDPTPVTITITNPNTTFLNGPFYIAEHVDLSTKSFTVTNVTLNVHPGYVVNFVNESNPSQVYAQSAAFSLMASGTPQASQATISQSSPSATGTSPAGNASGSGSGSATASGASATASGASATSSNKPSSSLRSLDGSLMALVPLIGMSALMTVVGALTTL